MDSVRIAESFVQGASALDQLGENGDDWLLISLGELEFGGQLDVVHAAAGPWSEAAEASLFLSTGAQLLTQLQSKVHGVLFSDSEIFDPGSVSALTGFVLVLEQGLDVDPKISSIVATLFVRRLGVDAWEDVRDAWAGAPASMVRPTAMHPIMAPAGQSLSSESLSNGSFSVMPWPTEEAVLDLPAADPMRVPEEFALVCLGVE